MKKLLFVFLSLFPVAIQAAEITFTKYITYKGAVNENNQPSGKGKLEIVYNQSSDDVRKDVLEGEFNNGVVTDAKLGFAKYNGPLWINKGTFKGTVEYQIAPDGSSVTFKMIDGKFKDSSYRTITATPKKPFEIKRTPHDNNCDMKAGPFLTNFLSPSYHSNLADLLKPFDATTFGEEKSFTQAETFMLGKDWVLVPLGTVDVIEFSSNIKFMKIRTLIGCEYPNGDDFTYDTNKMKIDNFKKSYQDAIVEYKEATNEATIYFNDKGVYKGTVSLGKGNLSVNDLFKKIMQTEKYSDSDISFLNGVLEREGRSTEYRNGITAEEERRQKREKEMAMQKELEEKEKKVEEEKENKRKENEKVTQQLKAELSKKYGKTFVEAADQGRIIVGMHEDLVGLVIKYIGASVEMSSDNGKTQVYDVYAIRDVYNTIKSTWVGKIYITNHKVSYIKYGKRWNK